jgi:hypothetical protein
VRPRTLSVPNNRGLHKCRSPNTWNMFTSQKLNEVNEGISVFLCWFLKTNTPQVFLLDDAGNFQHSLLNISKISPLNICASLHLKRKNSGTMSSTCARTASKLCIQIQRHYKNKSMRCLRTCNKKYIPQKCLFPSLI